MSISFGNLPLSPSGFKKVYFGDSLVWKKSGGGRLPEAYQEVEYLESTESGPYINTGVKPQHEKFKVEIKAKITNYGGAFGSQIGGSNTSNHLVYANQLFMGNTSTISSNIFSPTTEGTVIIESDGNNNYSLTRYDGSVVTGTYAGTIMNNKDYYLFAMNGITLTQNCFGRLYYTKIWDNDVLVRNLIPCYHKTSLVAGMYDLANPLNITEGKTLDQNGNIIDDEDSWMCDDYIAVSGNTLLKITGGSPTSLGITNVIVEYDENKNRIHYYYNYNRNITTEANTRYIRVAHPKTYLGTYTVSLRNDTVIFKSPFYTNAGTGTFIVGPDAN